MLVSLVILGVAATCSAQTTYVKSVSQGLEKTYLPEHTGKYEIPSGQCSGYIAPSCMFGTELAWVRVTVHDSEAYPQIYISNDLSSVKIYRKEDPIFKQCLGSAQVEMSYTCKPLYPDNDAPRQNCQPQYRGKSKVDSKFHDSNNSLRNLEDGKNGHLRNHQNYLTPL